MPVAIDIDEAIPIQKGEEVVSAKEPGQATPKAKKKRPRKGEVGWRTEQSGRYKKGVPRPTGWKKVTKQPKTGSLDEKGLAFQERECAPV